MPGGALTDTNMDRVRIRLGVTPAQARVLLRLYQANGDVVLADDLMDVCSGHWDVSPAVLKVQISNTRRKIGRDAIPVVWGRGYRLSVGGLETVRGAIA